jgi:hypothetical protein
MAAVKPKIRLDDYDVDYPWESIRQRPLGNRNPYVVSPCVRAWWRYPNLMHVLAGRTPVSVKPRQAANRAKPACFVPCDFWFHMRTYGRPLQRGGISLPGHTALAVRPSSSSSSREENGDRDR